MRRERRAVETPPPASFAEQLRRLRRERGLSQEGLAQRLGLTRTAICSYEAGHSYPSPRRLPEFARALAVPEGELARLLPPRATPSTPFGREVRELRERRGWTQERLAVRIGCAAGVISDYEVDGIHPAPEKLDAIAAALGVPRRRLRALVPKRSPPKRATAFGRLLRETRIARGMTQQQLAEAVGFPARQIAIYETTNRHPRKEHLPGLIARLAKALALPPAEIEASLSQPRPARVPTDFGHRLRQLRVDRGLTQEQLGARCGCSFSLVSCYETGGSYPKPGFLPALARALDVGVGELERLLPRPQGKQRTTPLGSELRRLREERGWTQEQLAQRAGLRRHSISFYEANGTYPRPRPLAALVRALGVSPAQLAPLLPAAAETTPFGRELRRLREERGLTLQQLALRSGSREGSIWHYEHGRTRPPLRVVAAFAEALDVSPDQLERLLPPQPETTPLGRELKRLRQERGLSQRQLATRLGCSPTLMSHYERGRKRPRTAVLTVLARALDVPKERLSELLPPRSKPKPLGQKLRRLREQRGLSQKRLAARIGRGQGTISAYERDRNRPGSADLAALAQALGVPEQQLQL